MEMKDSTWCVRCRSSTLCKDKELIRCKNGRYRQSSACVNCDTKKSRFIKQHDVEGGALPDPISSYYAKIAGSAYEPESKREAWLKQKGISGLDQDEALSDKQEAVYLDKDKKRVIVAFRGSVDKEDLKTDARIVLGRFKKSKRYEKSEKLIDTIKEKYPDYKLVSASHSLGARIGHDLGVEKKHESHSFNVGSAPIDMPKGFWAYLKCKINPELCSEMRKNNHVYHTALDPLSISALVGSANTKIYTPKVANPHSLDNFIMDESEETQETEKEE